MQNSYEATNPFGIRSAPARPVAIAVRLTKPSVPVGAAAAIFLLMVSTHAASSLGMPDIELSVMAAVFFASMLSSIAGFAFSAICGALLLHVMQEPVAVVKLMVVCSIAIQSLSVWTLRSTINWKALPFFVLGGVTSLPLGVYLLLHMPVRPFAVSMGLFLTGYGAFMLLRPPMRIASNSTPIRDCMAGLIGGITGGLGGFPGALVTIWCSVKPWDKNQQRGVYQPFILIMQVLTLLALHVMAPAKAAGPGVELAVWMYVPAALLGTWFGLKLFKYLSDRQFVVAINLLLIVSGIGMLIR